MGQTPIRYAIRNAVTGWYYTATNGNVSYVSNISFLLHSPMTWEGEQLKWVRNTNYLGVFRSQNENGHRFAKDGASILRYIFSTEGTLAKYNLEIHWLNTTTQEYSLLCATAINFMDYKDTRDYVEVTLKEGGLISKIKAFENTDFDIPVQDADSIPVLLNGIKLDTVYQYVSVGFSGNVYTPTSPGSNTISVIMGLGQYDTTGAFNTGAAQSAMSIASSSLTETLDNNAVLKLYRDAEVVIDFDLNFYYEALPGNAHPQRLAMYVTSYSDNSYVNKVIYKVWIDPVGPLPAGQNRQVRATGSYSLLCAADDRLVIHVGVDDTLVVSGMTDQIKWNVENGNSLNLKTISYTPQGIVKGYRTKQIFDKIVDKISGGAYTVKSNYLANGALSLQENFDTIPYRNIYTCGDALKGLGSASAPPNIRTRFGDVVQNIKSIYNVGIGIENEQLVVESLEYFFRSDVLIYDLGNNIDEQTFEFAAAKDFFASTIECGYRYESQNELNGRDEFNVKINYTTPFDNSSNKVNWNSPYTAGMVGIEISRLNVSGKTAPDSGNDNSCYVLAITDQVDNVTNAYKLETNGQVSGITYPETAYNVPLSPNRNIYRHRYWLTSVFKDIRNGDKKLTYQSSERNAYLESVIYAAMPAALSANVDFNNTDTHIFKPYTFSFDAISPDNLVALMNVAPYGVIGFTYKGTYYEGFVMEAGINPAKRTMYRFVLLASPKCDLSLLF